MYNLICIIMLHENNLCKVTCIMYYSANPIDAYGWGMH